MIFRSYFFFKIITFFNVKKILCTKCLPFHIGTHWYIIKYYVFLFISQVDFFWINRDQRSFEWFVHLLSQLEIEQAESGAMERFLDMHMYITSALQRTDMKAVGLQLALDLLHEKVSWRHFPWQFHTTAKSKVFHTKRQLLNDEKSFLCIKSFVSCLVHIPHYDTLHTWIFHFTHITGKKRSDHWVEDTDQCWKTKLEKSEKKINALLFFTGEFNKCKTVQRCEMRDAWCALSSPTKTVLFMWF